MSKEIDKFKKACGALEKQADAIEQDYAAHGTNRKHHKDMLLESSKEIGRVVQTLKDAGKTGTQLKDFANESAMMPVMKTALNALGQLGKEESRLDRIMKDAAAVLKQMNALNAEIDKEVTARKKKKDRKVLAVDSKSLPEMEKLLGDFATRIVDFQASTIDLQKMEQWALEKDKKNFDTWCTQEIAKTKADRKTRDTAETDERMFDDRVIKREMGAIKKLVVDVKTACGQAEKHFKNRETTQADAELQKAWDYHAQIKKMYEPHARQLAKMNAYDRKGLEQSKEGKVMIASIEQMGAAVDALSKLIKKFSRATI
ncbi:MAG: hypothetical protein RQ752_09535 [Thermohalobaculum sp.]|nr:hypothetical protein [Thermohalobaculum sp.]